MIPKSIVKEITRYTIGQGHKLAMIYENGNHYTGICTDGTRVRATKDPKDTGFRFDYAENCDVKITNHCTAGCPFCHEGSSREGKHADLNLPIFNTWKPGTEIAIGGGNVLDHPDLIPFLEKLKKQNVVANITVNQKAVFEQFELLTQLITKDLVKGVGISITDPSNKDHMKAVNQVYALEYLRGKEDLVCHVIAGIFNESFVPVIEDRKVLFLGYKDNVGRGVGFNKEHHDEIDKNIEWLANNLESLRDVAAVMSFDNLALAQLDARKNLKVSEDEWKLRFQGKDYGDPNGDDAPSTFYFDAVNQTIGRSSTQPYNERIKYTNQTFEEAFKASLSNYKVNEGEYGELNYKD